jgi:hypothetical protein
MQPEAALLAGDCCSNVTLGFGALKSSTYRLMHATDVYIHLPHVCVHAARDLPARPAFLKKS